MKRRIQPLLTASLLLCLLSLLAPAPYAVADWINLTGAETAPNIAEIYVQDDHVKLVLEVYIGDLQAFADLVPDDLLSDPSQRPPLVERLQRFSTDTFQFVTDTGHTLRAEHSLVEPRLRTDRQSPFAGMINPITRQRVPEAPTDKRVLYAELIYPFKDTPAALTIVPPLDAEGRPLVTIGFLAYHKAVPIIDFRYLGAPAQLTFIDPAGPLLTYVTPDDNVHTWTNYLKTYVIPQVEAVAVADALATFSLPVGSLVCLTLLVPLVGQIRTRRKSARPIRSQVGLAAAALMASILVYPYLSVSVARPAPLAPQLTETEAQTILHSLLKNVYRAFDFRAEEDVYDKLAVTVSGDLLADIYLQHRQSLAIQQAGGAQAKVKAVELLDVTVETVPERPLAYALQAE